MSVTVSTLIADALADIKVGRAGEPVAPDDLDLALRLFNRYVAFLNTQGRAIYAVSTETFALTSGLQPHTIGVAANSPTWTVATARPSSIVAANLVIGSGESRAPLPIRDRQWWMSIRSRLVTSDLPSGLYYEPTWPNGSVYLWPVPTANSIELQLRTLLSGAAAATDELDLPSGYEYVLQLGLSEVLAPAFGQAIAPAYKRRADDARGAVWALNDDTPNLLTLDGGMPGAGAALAAAAPEISAPATSGGSATVACCGYLDVTDYGVVGNGLTDDTTAFQAAITAATAGRRGVWIPAGVTIRTTAPVSATAGLTIQGEHRDSSRIFVDHDGVGVAIDADSVSSVRLADLTFTGELVFTWSPTARTNLIALQITTTHHAVVQHCAFLHLAVGIKLIGAGYYNTISMNLFRTCLVGLHTDESAGDGPSEANIVFNQFDGWPVSEGGPGSMIGILINGGSALKFIGNGFENLATGLDLGDSEYCTLVSCRFEDNAAHIAQNATIYTNILIGGFDDSGRGFPGFVGFRVTACNQSATVTALGVGALGSLTSGTENTAVGGSTLASVAAGTKNTAVGYAALATTTGTRNVALGHAAGLYETGDEAFYVDNRDRGSLAAGKTQSLLYGIFAAATANQRLRVNGRFAITEAPTYANNAAALAGGLDVGECYRITATDALAIVH